MDPAQTFLEVLKETKFRGEPDQKLVDATNAYGEAREDGQPMPPEIVDGLHTLPIYGASWLSILFGSAVENGRDPQVYGPSVWEGFLYWMQQLPASVGEDDDLPEMTDEQERILEVLPVYVQGVVAHIARMPELTASLSADGEVRQRIEFLMNYSHAFVWIDEILSRASGQLLLLHVEAKRALKCRYKNVSNCFHLFSLLQGTIGESLPGGQAPNPAVFASALGDGSPGEDSAWWHYGDPHSPEANVVASIFGEANVEAIPEIDGIQVMLLWPMVVESRMWDAGFFGPPIDASKPSFEIEEELDASEAKAWFEKLNIVN